MKRILSLMLICLFALSWCSLGAVSAAAITLEEDEPYVQNGEFTFTIDEYFDMLCDAVSVYDEDIVCSIQTLEEGVICIGVQKSLGGSYCGIIQFKDENDEALTSRTETGITTIYALYDEDAQEDYTFTIMLVAMSMAVDPSMDLDSVSEILDEMGETLEQYGLANTVRNGISYSSMFSDGNALLVFSPEEHGPFYEG